MQQIPSLPYLRYVGTWLQARPVQTDVRLTQQRMHSHSDAETRQQEEISSVWIRTGRVERCCHDEGGDVMLQREREREKLRCRY